MIYRTIDREKDMLIGVEMDKVEIEQVQRPEQVQQEPEKRELMLEGIEKTYPSEICFDGMLGAVHNQIYNGQGLGTCYAEAATAWIEYWVWRKTGRLIQFTKNEIFDVAVDAKTMYGYDYRKNTRLTTIFATGGSPNNVFNYAYKYNLNLGWHYFTDRQESQNFKLFRELAEKCLKDKTFRTRSFNDLPFTKDEDSARKNATRILAEHGPFVYVSYTDSQRRSTHAWLAVGANKDGLLMRNSYGDPSLCMDKWGAVVKYATDGTWNCVPMIETKMF